MPDPRWTSAVAVACALVVTSALAADVRVRGRRMVVRERPVGETHRSIVVVGRAPTTSATFPAPLRGVYLRVHAAGETAEQSQLFFLEPSGWSAVGDSYRYTGPGPDGSPVEEAVVRIEPGKPARVRVVLRGELGSDALKLHPPAPGTVGGLSIGTADGTFCVVLGGDAGGTSLANTASLWRIRGATADVACPSVPTPLPSPVLTPTPQPCDTLCSPTPAPSATAGMVVLRPNGAGTYTEWGESFPGVGGAHWQNVDDEVPDEAVSYLQDNTWSGVERDTFVHPASLLAPETTIGGVEVCLRARQTDNDGTLEDNGVAILIRGASGEAERLVAPQLTSTWTTYCTTWTANPTTFAPWTVADVDALEIGARNAMSPGSTDGVRVTQMWMIVHHAP